MPVDRRGWVIAFEIGQPATGRSQYVDGWRQPSSADTSRMTRECQVRICERLEVKFPGPTRPKELPENMLNVRCEVKANSHVLLTPFKKIFFSYYNLFFIKTTYRIVFLHPLRPANPHRNLF